MHERGGVPQLDIYRKFYLKMLPVDRQCRLINQITYPSQLLQMMIFSVDVIGKSIA